MALGHIASLAQSARYNLGAGYGSLGYEPEVFYFFGFPRAIEPGGVAVNVWVASIYEPLNGDKQKRTDGQLQLGILGSALEHAVPEQLFTTDPNNPPQGVSAVKALQLAQQQGQRLYHITPANKATTLPNIHQDSLTLTEIQQGLNAGKEVIVHTNPISVPGWTGAGYIIFDPEDGSGAYKITGGGNGGVIDLDTLNEFLLYILGILFDLLSDWAGKLLDSFLVLYNVISTALDCWEPLSYTINYVIISFFLVVGLIGLALLTIGLPLLGTILGGLFGFIMAAFFINPLIEEQCGT